MYGRESSMGGWKSTAGVGSVHDVVVNQSACLQELQRGHCGQGPLVVTSSRTPPTPPGKGRAKSLSTRAQVRHRFNQWVEFIADRVKEGALATHEIAHGLVDSRPQVLRVQGCGVGRHGHPESLRARGAVRSRYPIGP